MTIQPKYDISILKAIQLDKIKLQKELSKIITEKIYNFYQKTSLSPSDIHIYHCYTMGKETPNYNLEIDLKI
jgi:hypothetical protein